MAVKLNLVFNLNMFCMRRLVHALSYHLGLKDRPASLQLVALGIIFSALGCIAYTLIRTL